MALRRVAPGVTVHTDSSQAATVRAVVEMASADILVLGSSGFSSWAGLFSCGVKLGSADTGALPCCRGCSYAPKSGFGAFIVAANR